MPMIALWQDSLAESSYERSTPPRPTDRNGSEATESVGICANRWPNLYALVCFVASMA